MTRGIVGLLSCGFVLAFAAVAIDRRFYDGDRFRRQTWIVTYAACLSMLAIYR
jgi:hypothetical protein